MFDMTQFIEGYATQEDMKAWADSVMQAPPHFEIGDYMQRWYIIPRNEQMNLYLHRTLTDDEEIMHDHPWDNTSFVIDGGYLEATPQQSYVRRPGDLVARKATDAHRLVLIDNKPSVSLFLTGPKVREWGFLCPKGWLHWSKYTNGKRNGRSEVGGGCGELG